MKEFGRRGVAWLRTVPTIQTLKTTNIVLPSFPLRTFALGSRYGDTWHGEKQHWTVHNGPVSPKGSTAGIVTGGHGICWVKPWARVTSGGPQWRPYPRRAGKLFCLILDGGLVALGYWPRAADRHQARLAELWTQRILCSKHGLRIHPFLP